MGHQRLVSKLHRVVGGEGWKRPYNRNDLRDAIAYLFKKETAPKVTKDIKLKGYKTFTNLIDLDPKELFYSFSAKPKGWGKNLSETELLTELEDDAQRPADFFGWIKDTHAQNNLKPLITINGQIGDGLGRSLYFHATGEDVLVAEFETDYELDGIW